MCSLRSIAGGGFCDYGNCSTPGWRRDKSVGAAVHGRRSHDGAGCGEGVRLADRRSLRFWQQISRAAVGKYRLCRYRDLEPDDPCPAHLIWDCRWYERRATFADFGSSDRSRLNLPGFVADLLAVHPAFYADRITRTQYQWLMPRAGCVVLRSSAGGRLAIFQQ